MIRCLLAFAIALVCLTFTQAQESADKDPLALEQGKSVEREMNGGNVHQYRVSLAAGQFLKIIVEQRGIDVLVKTFRPDGAIIEEVDSPNGTQGPEPTSIAVEVSGIYKIEVRSFDAKAASGRYEIKIEELLSAEQYRARLLEERARDEAVIAQLKKQAISLKTITAGNGFNDLMPLKKILKDIRVVGFGEATHGTREFFQIRHRMLEFLVREMNFTVLAVEASYAASLKINDYVLHGKGNRAEILADQKTWILDTEEVGAIIDWIRDYNRHLPEEKKVKFFGIDPQTNESAMEMVVSYIHKVAPAETANAEDTFQKIRPEDSKAVNFERTEVSTVQVSELYKLIGYLVLNKARFINQSSAAEFEKALHNLRLVTQFAEFNSSLPSNTVGTRDRYMAENFQYLVNAEKLDTRFIVWAHNAHISKRGDGNFPAMGSYLNKTFGKNYYAFGFAFNQGSFQAQVAGDGKPRVLEFTLGTAPEKTVDWYFNRAGIGNHIADFRGLPVNEAMSQWLRATNRMHWVGAIFSDKWTESQWTQPFLLSRDFDGIIFIEKTTRARPTATGKRDG